MNASVFQAALNSPSVSPQEPAANDMLAEALDVLQMGILVVDRTLQIRTINRAAKRMVSEPAALLLRDGEALCAVLVPAHARKLWPTDR